MSIVLGGLAGDIAWNVLMRYSGLPSNSSRAFIGGVVGAMLASVGTNGVIWRGIMAKVFGPGIRPVITVVVASSATFTSRRVTKYLDDLSTA